LLYSSITSYHFQQILVSQSAIICQEILSEHFSQHRRQAQCTAVPLQIVELSHSHATWLLVDTKSKIPLLTQKFWGDKSDLLVNTRCGNQAHSQKF